MQQANYGYKATDENNRNSMGSLKIFFGYAAGVGKTYAMLEEAHELKELGVNVVLGYLEPHERKETLIKAHGLEQIAPQKILYHGMNVNELDLDEALRRKPSVILVDELAHTNALGTRHEKRYQDIEELLNNGIDVYTTLNLQHLESMNNVVESLTGIKVRETVPDYLFDQAAEVKLVDIEPNDLLARLDTGKIYSYARAAQAKNGFFKINNLSYLRELAVRKMALRLSRKKKTAERLLVCISDSQSNQKVIRSAVQLANAFSCELLGVHISKEINSSHYSTQLVKNIKLAELLGVKVTTVYGSNQAQLIAEYAQRKSVSKIILGSSSHNTWLDHILQRDLSNNLNRLLPKTDKYVIPQQINKVKKNTGVGLEAKKLFTLPDLTKTFAVLAGATLVGELFQLWRFDNATIILVYILGVLITSWITKTHRYSFLYSFLMILAYNYFFTIPYISLKSSQENLVTFLIMFLVAFLSSSWTTRLRSEAKLDAKRAARTELLLQTSRLLQQANTLKKIYQITGKQLNELLNCDICIYPKKGTSLGTPFVFPNNKREKNNIWKSERERAVATWTLKNDHRAGYKTDTLTNVHGMYLPLKGSQNATKADSVNAVVGLNLRLAEQPDSFTLNLAISICNECAEAITRVTNLEKQNQVFLAANKEKLRSGLLRGISHDLRTPLMTISGNTDILMQKSFNLGEKERQRIYHAIHSDAAWLNDLVENLLAMTKIDKNPLEANRQPELVDDIFQNSMTHLNEKAKSHVIKIDLKDPTLMINVDAQLVSQVIINIMNNAIQYTPKGSLIKLSAKSDNNGMVQFNIFNNGPHLESNKIFELFYTHDTRTTGRKGLGIGLALCKSIVEAYGGSISAKNISPQGVLFAFALPQWK